MMSSMTRRGFVALPMAVGGLFLGSCAGVGVKDPDVWLVSKIDMKGTGYNSPQITTIEYDDRGRVAFISPRTFHSTVRRADTGQLEYEYDETTERAFTWHDDEHVSEEVTTKRAVKDGKTEVYTDTFDIEFDPTCSVVTLTGATYTIDGKELGSYKADNVNDAEADAYRVEYEDGRVSAIKTGSKGCTFYKGVPLPLYEDEGLAKLPATKWVVIDESQQDHIDIKYSDINMESLEGDGEPTYDDVIVTYSYDDKGNIIERLLADELTYEYGYIHVSDPAKCAAFCSALILAALNTDIRIISNEKISEVHSFSDM